MENQTPKKILLAENDEKFALSLAALFSGQGYQTTIALDTTHAIRSAASEGVDLVVLDLGLPGGGGLFVIETLRRIPKTSGLPILVLTANIALGTEEKAKQMGANDFILKSRNSQELLARIKTLLA
ncbi:MAG: response regulator [Candidatus Omnitrophica bacterium]|nr:response regulator [Candidatus Omnitrophota bacterium]